MADRILTYTEFWPYYLREHRKASTRWLHFAGTNLAFGIALLAAVTRNPWLVPGALVNAYAFAWLSHFLIEKNRPATFTYPAWSFVSDLKMAGLMWVGRLGPELQRAGATEPVAQPAVQ